MMMTMMMIMMMIMMMMMMISSENEPPAISVCHKLEKRRIANLHGLGYSDYAYSGNFVPDGFEAGLNIMTNMKIENS